jgi:hypothetical protein
MTPTARTMLEQAATVEELIGKLQEAADLLQGKGGSHATAYFAMGSGLLEAARALRRIHPTAEDGPTAGAIGHQ